MNSRKIHCGVLELDLHATNAHMNKIPSQDIYLIKSLQNGGAWGKSAMHKIDRAEDDRCELCGDLQHSPNHVTWRCQHPDVLKARQEAFPMMADINPDIIPALIQQGVATVMSPLPDLTFWGDHWHTIRDNHAKIWGSKVMSPSMGRPWKWSLGILINMETRGSRAKRRTPVRGSSCNRTKLLI